MAKTQQLPEVIDNGQKPPTVVMGSRGVQLQTMEDAWRFATALSKSRLAPKGVDTPEACLIAIQMGAEVGLPPMAAIQNIAVINGRPAIYGDAALAVVRASGELVYFKEWFEQAGVPMKRPPNEYNDHTAAVCRVQRKGDDEPEEYAFSVLDAKTAGLWGKAGPWTQYPGRMLKFRARGFLLRDKFADVLRGFKTVEEVQDYDEPRDASVTMHEPASEPEPVAETQSPLDRLQAQEDQEELENGNERAKLEWRDHVIKQLRREFAIVVSDVESQAEKSLDDLPDAALQELAKRHLGIEV